MNRRRVAAALAGLLACGLATAPVPEAAATTSSVLTGHVLIYGPSLAAGPGFNEATVARSLGYDVAIADSIAWNALDRADFARYDAIIIGDSGCSASSPRYMRTAAATRGRWTPALTGNVSVVGTDPVFHVRLEGTAAARRLVRNGLRLATAATTTGAYISLGCAYFNSPAFTTVSVLSGFGPFTARGQGVAPLEGCPNTIEVKRPQNPLVRGLTGAALSGWGCSIHAGVDSFPFPFLVVGRDAQTKIPYLLMRPPSSVTSSERRTVYSGPRSTTSPPRAPITTANSP